MEILDAHEHFVTCLAYSQGALQMGSQSQKGVLYSGSRDKTVRAWNPEKGSKGRVFSGHHAPVTCVVPSLADNGKEGPLFT